MTRALHEFVASHRNHETIEDPEELTKLDQEFLATVHDFHTHVPEQEEVEDVAEASEQIKRGLGKLSLQEVIALIDAAITTGDARLGAAARDTIDARFPTEGTGHAAYEAANVRSKREWTKALEIAEPHKGDMLFSDALLEAQVITDKEFDEPFDSVIDTSNLTVREQRGKITEREQQDLNKYRENRRRNEERRKLEEVSADDENFDDAVAYNPFDDDDEDDDTPKAA